MPRLPKSIRVAFALVVALVVATPASAVVCFRDDDCAAGQFGGIRECTKSKVFGVDMFFGTCVRPGACNQNSECNPGASCINGTCLQPGAGAGGSSGSGSGSGTGTSGEGRRCMPADGSKPADWAKDKFGKPLGACPTGTRCNNNGFCVRLET